ncbi:hypothetical protein K438DRAFT_1969409 [Mycena galopus ATCC 62051]|nr:hypothetical protein K438DRAFT_1969409 [Mycena galopus ATCC 62051]
MSTTQTYTISSPLVKPASGSGSGLITLSPSLAPSLSTSSSMASPSIPTSTSTSTTSTSTSAPCVRFDADCRKNTRDAEDEQHVVQKVVLPRSFAFARRQQCRAEAGIWRAGGTPIIHAGSYEAAMPIRASAHVSAPAPLPLPLPNTSRRGWCFMSL